jgi:hypothetical protein
VKSGVFFSRFSLFLYFSFSVSVCLRTTYYVYVYFSNNGMHEFLSLDGGGSAEGYFCYP